MALLLLLENESEKKVLTVQGENILYFIKESSV
jgi:hypothetical protein